MRHQKNRNNHNQYNARFNYGQTFGQRMQRPQLPHVPPFGPNPNAVNLQTSLSIQTLNHSKSSPFQSPKHENQNDTMQQIWKSMANNTNMLPKPPINTSLPDNSNQSTQPKLILENKSRARNNQKAVAENKKPENTRPENTRQNAPQSKPNINLEFIDTCRQLLVRHCHRIFSLQPKFETISFGPMNTKAIALTLPDGKSFRTSINMHPSVDEAYEYISYDALKHLNDHYSANINLKRPQKLLPSPSFMFSQPNTQTSPNRPRIAESSLPRPPSRWIAQQRPNVPVLPFERPPFPVIPESFVAHNNKLLNERQQKNEEQRSQQRQSSRNNANTSPTNQVRKKLFDHRNDSSNTTQRTILNRNNQRTQRDNVHANNGGQTAERRQGSARQPSTSHGAFENKTAFVPLQVARNNQSHKSPHKSLSQSSNESNNLIEINSTSSEDVEILTPETVVQISNNPNDEIEILTPESLGSPSTQNSSNRRRQPRRARLGVNLGN